MIPLSWARAQLGDQSEFRLEFTRAAPLSQIRVLLNGVAERLAGTAQGNTQSIVASCAASGVPVSANVWSDCVAILEQPNAPPLLVSIERYEFAAHLPGVAPNGTAVRP